MDGNELFGHFQQAMQQLGKSVHILDTMVPVERQMEYFKYSEYVRANSAKETVDRQIAALQFGTSSFEQLRYALTYLAVSNDVRAYRAIEEFAKKIVDPRLEDWISLSLMQAKLAMNAEFTDERQVFVSTGLGGRGCKFRFYSFFRSNGLKPFSDYQRKLIEKEFAYAIEHAEGEIEEIRIEANYFYILFLCEMTIDVRYVLQCAQDTCNEFGDFIDLNFTLTNVKMFDASEIQLALHEPAH